jgi:two-component system sensor histidine kinase ArlS
LSLNLSGRGLAAGTISEKIRNLPLRSKLTWGYTTVFTLFFAIGFTTVYVISEKYRKEEFYQRLEDRMHTTYKILVQVDQISQELLKIFDRNTINRLSDEKILLFDANGNVIYNSIDDTRIAYSKVILKRLMNGEGRIEMTDGKYELLALQFMNDKQVFYGISKAHDRFGKSKIAFLKNALIAIFFTITPLLILTCLWLSRIIMQPIRRLTKDIATISPKDLSVRIDESRSKDEISILTDKFNELLDKVESAFKFQYHFVHHASHELKTPLSVMMSNAEGALADGNIEVLKRSMEFQKHNLMEVSYIINAMLEISKTENQINDIFSGPIRVDELLFECIDEISYLDTHLQIDFIFSHTIEDSEVLTINGNSRMLKIAFMNLLKNAMNFAVSNPVIEVLPSEDKLLLRFSNDGEIIPVAERLKLFTHFFRGDNSKEKKGFGLGLVLVQRIISLHNGEISYCVSEDGKNYFIVGFPIS